MKKLFLAISLVVAVTGLAWGQGADTRGSASTNNGSSVKKQGRQVDLQSRTQVAAQLEKSLDARHAKAGDSVELRTIQAVKQGGKVVVPKGARLFGHVTDVQQQTDSNGESRIGVIFDRLRNGSTEIPITASILSIAQPGSRAQASNDLFETNSMAQSSSSARSSATSSSNGQGSGGGLLGGVGSTVGGVVNTTTSNVGNLAGSATNAVGTSVSTTTNTSGNTAGNLTGALRGLQITQSSNASAEGESTLSLTGRNLRLESGPTFNLAVSNSTGRGANP
jgi:hypothetical protein